jgi:hypothetical protein
MEAAAANRPKPAATELLLAHCATIAGDDRVPSAAARLEALLGRELAGRLVSALSSRAAKRVL